MTAQELRSLQVEACRYLNQEDMLIYNILVGKLIDYGNENPEQQTFTLNQKEPLPVTIVRKMKSEGFRVDSTRIKDGYNYLISWDR